MTIPTFEEITLPLLKIAGDAKVHVLAEVRRDLARDFGLTPAEEEELLPSGRQSRFANRVAWAKVYMQRGGLLCSPGRGQFQITERGREVLASPPAKVDIKFLERFPEFLEFRSRVPESTATATEVPDSTTPEEALETAYRTVGRPEIQKFVGALHGKRARKGVFITTGTFSADAVAYVQNIDPKVALIDGAQLAQFMIDFDVGVSPDRTYQVKKIDSDYFEEDG